MSFKDIKHTSDFTVPKHFLAKRAKLNGTNYLLWVKSFCLFVGSQKKLKHLAEDPPAKSTIAYDDWIASDYSVMTWLLNIIDEKAYASIMFQKLPQRYQIL